MRGTATLLLLLCWLPARAQQAAPAWYRGDLHVHTSYSDGDSSVAEVVAMAEQRGLDFLAITDHDTSTGGVPRAWDDPAFRSARMLLLYGIEWTTGKGHANILSAHPFATDLLWLANRAQEVEAAVRAAHEAGALFSINHPAADICCPWRYDVPAGVDAMEVWNAPFRFPNKGHRALREVYQGLLLHGRRLGAVGGSDSHALEGFEARVSQPGSPTTWVYATERSAEGIIEGIRAGHVSVSYSSIADRLELRADADRDGEYELMAGDVAAAGHPVALKAEVRGANRLEEGIFRCRSALCLIYRSGKVVKRAILRRNGDSVTLTDTPDEGTFYRAELRGTPRLGLMQRLIGGRLLALTNPLYAGSWE